MASLDLLLFNLACFVAGLFVLEYGADRFVDNTAILATRLNVSPTLVGLLTCGAEWEELVVIAVAVGRGEPSLALGNLVGSSIANVLASFSLGLLCMKTSTFDRSSKLYATTLLGLTSFFLLFMYLIPPRLKWLAGVVSMIAFVAYVTSVASLIYKGTLAAPEDDSDSDSDDDVNSNGSSSDEDEHTCEPKRLSRSRSFSPGSNPANCELVPSAPARVGRRARSRGPPREAKPFWRCIVRLLVGLAALLLSSYIISHSAGTIADELGLSETVVGMTILSVATTLPEKFIAIMGGVRHQPEILVANTVGSNIFLVTLCAGVMFIWGDAEKLGLGFTFFEALAMWASSALVLLVVLGGGKRWIGAVFLGLYVAFFTVEFVNGRRLDED